MNDIEQILQAGIDHHQSGRVNEAEQSYRQVLTQFPDHPSALRLLGIVTMQQGNADLACELIRRAISLKPTDAIAHVNFGNALKARHDLGGAIAAYRHAIELSPHYPAAHYNLGIALTEAGELDQAIEAFRCAVVQKPDYFDAFDNLANVLKNSGRKEQAVEAWRATVGIRPDAYAQQFALGDLLWDMGRLVETIEPFQHALRLRPDDRPDLWNNLAAALREAEQFDEAVVACENALARKSDHASVRNNLACILQRKGDYQKCLEQYDETLRLKPDWPEPHWNLGMVLLKLGDFQRGWSEYEWRWRDEQYLKTSPRFSQPRWKGENLAGRTILLHAEQGFGDAIQFIRYAPLVKDRGGRVLLSCPPEVSLLLQSADGVDEVLLLGQVPLFDIECPLMSLPYVLGTDLQSIPRTTPYLTAPADRVEKWRTKMGPCDGRLRVGLVWAGRPTHGNDRNRSIAFSRIAPLLQLTSIAFYSLQKGDVSARSIGAAPPASLIDLTSDLHDFADTAALMACLDLVITVDTAVAHLAGALGKPVWLLIPSVAEWRWMLDRADSPWYPTIRLFRQKTPGDWESVINEVAAELILRGG